MKLFRFLNPHSHKETQEGKDQPTQYDSIAEQYATYVDQQKLNALYERPYIVSQLPPLSNLTFFDAGCGAGYFSKYAYKQGANVIAVDISAKLLEILKKQTSQTIETHVADLSENLDFIKDKSVDVIVCSLVLHYVKDWSVTIREFHRILKPGGTCVLSVHHPLFDYRFNKERYFEKRLVEDSWVGFGKKPLNVQYYVRPLKEYLSPITELKWSSFSIDEPLPQAELKETEPDLFRGLSNGPVFLFLKLVK